AGALGVDAEELALAQHAQAGAQGRLAGLAAGAVDGDGADAAEEHAGEEPLDAAAGEVVRLAEADDLALEVERSEEVVGERQVVAGEDGRPLLGHVLDALGHGPEDDVENR